MGDLHRCLIGLGPTQRNKRTGQVSRGDVCQHFGPSMALGRLDILGANEVNTRACSQMASTTRRSWCLMLWLAKQELKSSRSLPSSVVKRTPLAETTRGGDWVG